MSTRAMLHFYDVDEKGKPFKKPTAIIYRHGDGYPDGLGKDLKEFIKEVKRQCKGFNNDDYRMNDASYLSAKWIVYDALLSASIWGMYDTKDGKKDVKKRDQFPDKPLRFLSVGIDNVDHCDIEYRYKVYCGGEHNFKIVCEEVTCHDWKKGDIEVIGKPKVIMDTGKAKKKAAAKEAA